MHLLCQYECVIHEVFERDGVVEAQEEVGHTQCLVHGMVDHSGGKVVEAEHVCHLTCGRILHAQVT